MMDYDVRMIRLNSTGEILWDRLIDHGLNEYARDVIPTVDGGSIIAGCIAYTDDWPSSIFLMKTNALGDSEWFRAYDVTTMGENFEVALAAVQSGGYALVGTTASSVGGNTDVLIIRVADNGDSLWSRRYGDAHFEAGQDILAFEDGFLILGQQQSDNMKYQLIRTDTLGGVLWAREYPRGTTSWFASEGASLKLAPDGIYVIGGTSCLHDSDIYLIGVNSTGDEVWDCSIAGTGDQDFGDMVFTSDGGSVVAGSDGSRWLLGGLDEFGSILWMESVDMGCIYLGASLTCILPVEGGGYVAAGVNAPGDLGRTEAFIVRTAPDSTLAVANQPMRNIPGTYALRECYPNPFNSATRISFDLPVAGDVCLQVFDMTGRSVTTLTSGVHSAGQHTILFDAHDLASGTYFYRLRAGNFQQTQKMILLR
jgi:hypothetical protein